MGKKGIIDRPEIVVIVGNGFDMNLSLQTSYCNFIDSLEFQKLCDTGSEIANHLKKKRELENWVDVEEELKLIEKEGLSKNLINEFFALCDCLIDYLRTIDITKMNKSSKGYELIKSLVGKRYLVINYNYTNCVQHILKENGESDENIEKGVLHIHGSINENKIIFGVESDHGLNSNNHLDLIKSYSPIFDGNNLYKIFSKTPELVIFGHSIGITDKSDFDDYFIQGAGGNIKDHKFTIYYHEESGLLKIKKRLHAYLKANIGNFKRLIEFECLPA